VSDDFAIFSAADYLDNDEVIADFLAAAAEDGNMDVLRAALSEAAKRRAVEPRSACRHKKPRSDFPAQQRHLFLGERCAALREAPENAAAACPFTGRARNADDPRRRRRVGACHGWPGSGFSEYSDKGATGRARGFRENRRKRFSPKSGKKSADRPSPRTRPSSAPP
jgi:hypothetical protein